MTRKPSATIGLLATLAAVVALGSWAHTLWAAQVRPLPVAPRIIAGKFKPNPVTTGTPTTARMVGLAIPPDKVDVESLVALHWSWHLDKVQDKATAEGTYAVAAPATYEASVTSGGSIDSNAVLVLKPKHAGFWKVTVHATATYVKVNGDTYTGNSEPHEFFVQAVDKVEAPTTGSAPALPLK